MHTDTTAYTYTVSKPIPMPLLQVLADAPKPSRPEVVSHSAGPLQQQLLTCSISAQVSERA